MLQTALKFGKTAMLSAAIVLFTAAPSFAQRGGHGGRGGGHVGHVGAAHAVGFRGGHVGGYRGGRVGSYYRGGYGRGYGGRGYGGWGYGGRGYGGWGYGGWGGLGWGLLDYPYYGYGAGYYPYINNYYVTPYSVTPSYYPDTYVPYDDQPISAAAYPASSTSMLNSSTPATVQVMLPAANAQVWFNGHLTNQTGAVRQFVTPALTPGQSFVYDVRATWMVDGQPVTQTRQVTVRAGGDAVVNFGQ